MKAIAHPPVSPNSRSALGWCSSLILWLAKARWFTISALIHVLLVVSIGGTVLFKKLSQPPDFTSEPGSLVSTDPTPPVPEEEKPSLQQPDQYTPSVAAPSAATAPSALAVITTSTAGLTTLTMPTVAAPNVSARATALAHAVTPSVPNTANGGLSKEMAAGIARFTAGWAKGGTSEVGRPLKNREFEFTAYLAKYAGGDWNSTVRLENDQITGGSLPNLLFIMSKLSKNKIHAETQAVPLDLASDDIFAKKPPFIWFTGHRDFVLTDKEIANLAEYIRLGGCIWGDSSLPGERSRFDIAFRREMRRLIPDTNQQWKKLPLSHPIFSQTYYTEVRDVAPGINFYHEPIYAMEGYGGEIAILYTANDYGDMWQFGLDEKGEIDLSRDEKHEMVAVNEEMYYRRGLYFRNIEPKPLMDTYKFGTNIVIHLLTRWEDKLRNVPRTGM